MLARSKLFWLPVLLFASMASLAAQSPVPPSTAPGLVKKGNRVETIRATLKSFDLPNLEGPWYFAGPFDYSGEDAFERVLPPDRQQSLDAAYPNPLGTPIRWKPYTKFALGRVLNLKELFNPEDHDDRAVFLACEFEAKQAYTFPISLGSDDTLSVYFNGKRLLHENYSRAAGPDQDRVNLPVVVGKNLLVLKVGQYRGGWEVYVAPELPAMLPAELRKQIDQLYPPVQKQYDNAGASLQLEARYYAIDTFTPPEECVLEVGGLAFRPDGKLLACTRRGEIWLVHEPTSLNPQSARFEKYASGLHEALGLHVLDNQNLLVAQRPELTKVSASNAKGPANRFQTISDRWGVSGDYHEYCFGPAVDAEGNCFITLNVGFGGGHQAKAAYRGWSMKIAPDGTTEPFAYGLRSPNGINFSPEGDLFYTDNQGEWVASNKLHHLQRGKFYGHQAGLKWLPESPFAELAKASVPHGQRYDGVNPNKPDAPKVYPPHEPPAIWFPYGRMGQSTSEPRWDTTAGGFGPFTGQCFVGDQTRSMVMRVALEKVNGVYQGACFPFRSGMQCGVNRIVFGPDGALYVGQTSRGWGSTGGKPFGLQRIRYLGEVPPEIYSFTLTKEGFALKFTKPIDPATIQNSTVDLKSFTYIYHPAYGCPETDTAAETVEQVKLSNDQLTLTLSVPNRMKGRVYDLKLNGVKTTDGEDLVHNVAYYTLNEFLK